MVVESFRDAPPPARAEALVHFERQFTYPLGADRTFRIEHGDDYARFYRAIGEANCFVCADGAEVRGVLAVALRPLLGPDGQERPVGYIGDLKVAEAARFGMTLIRLLRAAEEWVRPRASAAFGVVMDGTPVVPVNYTGRAGVPWFLPIGKVLVLRFPCVATPSQGLDDAVEVAAAAARDCFRRLAAGRFSCPPGTPAERSLTPPVWLVLRDGSACGCLEDTRRAKRLIADDGTEMVSAHVSCFAYRDLTSAAQLLATALRRAAVLGYPALFVAVADTEAEGLLARLGSVEAVRAPATVFGHGLDPAPLWNINSSEI